MSNKLVMILAALILMISVGLSTYTSAPKLSLRSALALNPAEKITNQPKKVKELFQQSPNSWQIIFLGYTSCPDICPTTLMELNAIYAQLNQIAPVNIVFLSADPKRDSEEVARKYTQYFNKEFKSLVLPKSELDSLTEQLRLNYRIEPEENNPDSYAVIHSAALAVINPQQQLTALLKPEIEELNIATFNQEILKLDFADLTAFYNK